MDPIRISDRSAAEQAAMAMLVTLRAAAPGGERARAIRVLPAPDRVSLSDAAVALVLVDKPVVCRADAEGDVLVVELRAPVEGRLGWPVGVTFPGAGDGGPDYRPAAPDVLLIAADQSLLLSTDALPVWRRDYLIDMPYGIAGWEPTEEQRAAGVVWVLDAGQGGTLALDPDELDLPEPVGTLVIIIIGSSR
jgi:hypothetical protein